MLSVAGLKIWSETELEAGRLARTATGSKVRISRARQMPGDKAVSCTVSPKESAFANLPYILYSVSPCGLQASASEAYAGHAA